MHKPETARNQRTTQTLGIFRGLGHQAGSARRPPGRVSPEASRPGQPRGRQWGRGVGPPGAMQGRGLPFRVATLFTGLLECLGFAGVLFGWTSLVYVFKKQHYFEELCEPDAGSLGNATGLDGKGAGPSLESGSQVVGRRARQDSGPPHPHPGQAFYGEKKGASASPILNLDLRGAWGGRCPLPRAD